MSNLTLVFAELFISVGMIFLAHHCYTTGQVFLFGIDMFVAGLAFAFAIVFFSSYIKGIKTIRSIT